MAYGRKRGRPSRPLLNELSNIEITDEELDAIPEPPAHLNFDGKVFYYRIFAYGKEIVLPMDTFYVTETAEIYMEKELARREISVGAFPRYFMSPQGRPEEHPAKKALERLQDRLVGFLQELGFSTVTRHKLAIEMALKDDKVSDFVRRQEEGRIEMEKQLRELAAAQNGEAA